MQLAVVETTLYFVNHQQIGALPRGGGAPATLATATESRIGAFAIDGSSVYFTDWGHEDATGSHGFVKRVPKTGRAAAVLASEQPYPGVVATGFPIDSTTVFFSQTCGGAACSGIAKLAK